MQNLNQSQPDRFVTTVDWLIPLIESDAPLARKTRAVDSAYRTIRVNIPRCVDYSTLTTVSKLCRLLLLLLEQCMEDPSLDQSRKALYAHDVAPMITMLTDIFVDSPVHQPIPGTLITMYTRLARVAIKVLQNGGHSDYSSWMCAIDMIKTVSNKTMAAIIIDGEDELFEVIFSTIPMLRAISESSDEKLRREPELHRRVAILLKELEWAVEQVEFGNMLSET